MPTSDSNLDVAATPAVAGPTSITHHNDGRFTSSRRPPKVHWDAMPCEGPSCTNVIPAGLYAPQRLRSFCSTACCSRDACYQYIIGTCRHCSGPVMGRKDRAGKKYFCCDQHRRAHTTERILGPTGKFRAQIDEYMATSAANYYSPGTLPTVRVSIAKFFRFAVQVEKITVLEDIRPAVITRFIALERGRQLTGRNFVGHLSTFFNTLIAEEKYKLPNPVVSRIHSQRGAPAQARPYNDHDLSVIWESVVRTGKLQLMLAFAIGEECGLRIGEVQNIRLSDIDASAQTIFVRLPTKNKRTRTVPFHGKVKKYLELWMAKRNPDCTHDHVLHNNASKPFTGSHFDAWFKSALAVAPDPACTFHFHRLRHTWATRLMNNGMELAVLKVLGGWESWSSMQRYIKVLDSTVRGQYEASYAKLQERADSDEDETLSLIDFALMNRAEPSSLTAPTV